jgi:hypothetical protein
VRHTSEPCGRSPEWALASEKKRKRKIERAKIEIARSAKSTSFFMGKSGEKNPRDFSRGLGLVKQKD